MTRQKEERHEELEILKRVFMEGVKEQMREQITLVREEMKAELTAVKDDVQDKVESLEEKQKEMSFIVKTPTTTSIQLNTTTIDVGFDTIMTVHHHPPPPTQELYLSYTQQTGQCKLTQSLTILLDYLRQLSLNILDNYPRLS